MWKNQNQYFDIYLFLQFQDIWLFYLKLKSYKKSLLFTKYFIIHDE